MVLRRRDRSRGRADPVDAEDGRPADRAAAYAITSRPRAEAPLYAGGLPRTRAGSPAPGAEGGGRTGGGAGDRRRPRGGAGRAPAGPPGRTPGRAAGAAIDDLLPGVHRGAEAGTEVQAE
ncbi:hypothetical protein ACFVIN_35265, partial [Streptomyces prasinus]